MLMSLRLRLQLFKRSFTIITLDKVVDSSLCLVPPNVPVYSDERLREAGNIELVTDVFVTDLVVIVVVGEINHRQIERATEGARL